MGTKAIYMGNIGLGNQNFDFGEWEQIKILILGNGNKAIYFGETREQLPRPLFITPAVRHLSHIMRKSAFLTVRALTRYDSSWPAQLQKPGCSLGILF